MLDLRQIRREHDALRTALARRGGDVVERLDRVLELDRGWREATQAAEALRAEQKAASEEVAAGKREGSDVSDRIARLKALSGEVKLGLPLGEVTIDDWKGSSTKYANAGTKHYNIPSVLKGVKMQVSGEHRENGAVVCSGSVFVKVTGSVWSNPLVYGALGLLVISGGMLFFAGRPVFTKIQAYEDANPG